MKTKIKQTRQLLFFLALTKIFLNNTIVAQGWEKIEATFNPPGTYHFIAGKFFDENNGWALVDSGEILNTSDGGLTWDVTRSQQGYFNGYIFFLNDRIGWISYSNADTTVLLKTQNCGDTWEEFHLSFSSWQIYFIDDNTGFAIGDTNYCYRTIEGGKEWQSIDIGLPDTSVIATDIFFLDNQKGWMLAKHGEGGFSGTLVYYFLTTNDGGKSWAINNRFEDIGFTNIAFFDSLNGIVTQFIGEPYYTNDGGNTWSRTETIISSEFELVIIDSSTAWAVGTGIQLTVDKGKTWQKIENTAQYGLYDICFLNKSLGYAFGINNTLLKYKDVVGIREKSEMNKNELLVESYPNPTNSASIISFTLPQSSLTEITLYSIKGEKIKTVYDGYLSRGRHTFSLELKNFSSGVYFCNLKQGNHSKSIKIVLLK